MTESSTRFNLESLDKIVRRANYFASQMIHIANHRPNKEKGDPKIGGHPASCASSIHILGALHLVVRSGFDHIAVKPHAAPADHAFNYLLRLFVEKDFTRFGDEKAEEAMHGLRAFSKEGRPVFQSYHSAHDCDNHNYLPSGSVGIPPVNLGYLALAYQFAEKHGYRVPKDPHFWALIGDSEFREGSLLEAMPDFAEREIGNMTWIVDYNRQSLDGQRLTNPDVIGSNDDIRLIKTAEANGWQTILLKHGRFRQSLFKRKGGKQFQNFFDEELEDFQLQALLRADDALQIREELLDSHPQIAKFLDSISDAELKLAIQDLGGHDLNEIISSFTQSKSSLTKPCLVVAHTIKGWGLEMAAVSANHSMFPTEQEIIQLRNKEGLNASEPFGRFHETSPEEQFLVARGNALLQQVYEQQKLKQENLKSIKNELEKHGRIPEQIGINLKFANYPHSQWMLGQISAKLSRIATTERSDKMSAEESAMKLCAEHMVAMAPDVGTSTNLNPVMDGKIFGSTAEDFEAEFAVKDKKSPDLIPGRAEEDRFLRFEISEANVMSCLGSFGKMRDIIGIPLLPFMSVYDFFIKRALDQYFYNLYWGSSYILAGTPSGISLSPEGAQHGWKSDIQIPNQVTWEPFFCVEADWISAEVLRAHIENDNKEKTGVLIRGTTRGVDQKLLLKLAKTQLRFKQNKNVKLHPKGHPLKGATDESSVKALSDTEINMVLRKEVLAGAYWLIDYRGYADYSPGENVIHLFAMGNLGTEAIQASQELLEKGVYANVIIVTSPDLLLGNLAYENNYQHLREGLGIDSDLYVAGSDIATGAELMDLSMVRTPIVSVHDGEPGLLDNIGSILGLPHETLAVRKHSKSGRPRSVYIYHGIHSSSIVQAAEKILTVTAESKIKLSRKVLTALNR
jgi:pyruvate dehydrogenase E1 component